MRGVERVELAVQVVDLLELVLAVNLEQGVARGRLEEEQHLCLEWGARGERAARGEQGRRVSGVRGGELCFLSQSRAPLFPLGSTGDPRASADPGARAARAAR